MTNDLSRNFKTVFSKDFSRDVFLDLSTKYSTRFFFCEFAQEFMNYEFLMVLFYTHILLTKYHLDLVGFEPTTPYRYPGIIITEHVLLLRIGKTSKREDDAVHNFIFLLLKMIACDFKK